MNDSGWISNPFMQEFLLQLVASNAYRVYTGCLIGDAPRYIRDRQERITNPLPGDVVLEITAWNKPVVDRLGVLAWDGYEPDPEIDPENWNEETDEPIPQTRCWHIVTTDGRHYRWHNANFIQVETEAFDTPRQGIYSPEDKRQHRLRGAIARIEEIRRMTEPAEEDGEPYA